MSLRDFLDRPFSFDGSSPAYYDPYEFYYPIGNSLATDIIQGCQVGRQCDMLLLGCGDIRNILQTIHVLKQGNHYKLKGRKLNIHVNDIDDGILARDFIFLHLIHNTDPGNPEDLRFLWAVWYDVILCEQHHQRLKELMQNLTQVEDGTDLIYFGNEETKCKLRKALSLWMTSKVTARDCIQKKIDYLKHVYQLNFPNAPINRVSSRLLNQSQLKDSPVTVERYKEELRDYVMMGVTRINRGSLSSVDFIRCSHTNVTFFRPGTDKWQVQDNSSPYMCFDPGLEVERYDGLDTSMSSLYLEILQQWVESFQKSLQDGCTIKIYLWLGEATAVCEKDLPLDVKFDFIDTSNISDRIGLVPVLVHFQKRLKRNTGVLRTEVYHWRTVSKSVVKFLSMCLDIPLLMYPTVLGLHLADELVLGHEKALEEGTFVGLGKLNLRWRVARDHDQLTLSSTDGVSKALAELEHPNKPRETVEDCVTETVNIEVMKCGKAVRHMLKTRLMSLSRRKDEANWSDSRATDDTQTVHEHEDHYEVILQTDPELLKEGSLSLTKVGDDANVVILQNIIDGRPTVKRTMNFSCCISINSSKIKLSRKRGHIECTLLKDYNKTLGESVLPWRRLKLQDLASLPDYPQTEYAIDEIRVKLRGIYPEAVDNQQMFGPAAHQLKRLMAHFLFTAPMNNGIPCMISLGIPSATNPALNERNIFLLESWKNFENLPTVFITWYDLDLGHHLVEEAKADPVEYNAMCLKVHFGIAGEQGKYLPDGNELLKKILKTNSYRMKQDLPEDRRWKIKTFLRGRYPYTDMQSFLWEVTYGVEREATMRTLMNQVLGGGDVAEVIKELGLDQKMKKETQTSTRFGHSTIPGATASEQSNVSSLISTHPCAVCGGTSGCKRCTGCLKVYYCGRECQRKDWSHHKRECRRT